MKQEIINKFKVSAQDTGSAPVQIALLTHKIKELSTHFKTHKKDFHSMRGLMKAVQRRKKLLLYVKKNQVDWYQKVLKELSLRK